MQIIINIILLNWVLEHVLDLDNFFLTLKYYCELGTKVIFQVPDFEYYVNNDLHLFYVHEHIHYFTPSSLQQCLSRFGFKLLEYKNGDCPSLLACAEFTGDTHKLNYKSIEKTVDKFLLKGKILGRNANKIFDNYDNIFFYGIGTSAYWLGEYYLSDKIKNRVNIIDDNKFYFNKYVPSFNCQITRLEEVKKINNGIFFIGTSPVYRDKIIDKIINKVKGNFDILVIDNDNFNIIDKYIIK